MLVLNIIPELGASQVGLAHKFWNEKKQLKPIPDGAELAF